MINTTMSPVYTGTVAPAALPGVGEQPQPAICPKPLLCPDTLDFSTIDTAKEAALLPATEPALQLSLAAGVMFAVMAGAMGGGVPLVTIEMASKSADKLMSANYTLDLKNEQEPLSVFGDVDGQPLTDTFKLDEATESATFTGSIGSNPTSLTLGLDQATESLRVSGKLGSVDADLRYSAIKGAGGDDDIQGILAEGTLGGEAYRVETRFDASELQNKAQAGEEAKMSVRGTLGSEEISKDYTVTAQQNGSGAEISFKGAGTTAGVAQEVDVKLTLVG